MSVWENVAGALSSGAGADFGQVLYEMDEAGACFSEWRLLDAQYFGVPQRRRRVFLISVFDTATAARCPDPLLPVREGVQWHPQTSNQTRQTVAGEVAGCLRSGGAGGVPSSRGEHLVIEPSSFGSSNFGGWAETDTAITLSARDHKGGNTVTVEPFTPSQFAQYVEGVGTLRSNGGDLAGGSETLAVYTKGKRPQTSTDDETWDENRPAPTINAFDQGDTRATTVIVEEPVLLTMREGKPGGGKGPLLSEDKSLTLAAAGNDQTLFVEPIAIPIHDQATRFSGKRGNKEDGKGNGLGIGQEGDPMNTLTQGDRHAVAQTEPIHSFDTQFGSNANVFENHAPPLKASQASPSVVEPTMSVRRLTPLECERLMGWPDDWTAGQSDTHRYKQCGNGVASPVAQWIGEQIINL